MELGVTMFATDQAISPVQLAREIESRGFKIMIHTGTLAIAYRAVRDAMEELRDRGRISAAEDVRLFADLVKLLGVSEALARSGRYAG